MDERAPRTEAGTGASDEPREATPRALLLGVLMAVVMAAANAYLGLKAGMTIAATYTTAVVGMAVLKSLQRHDARGELRPDRGLDRRQRGDGRHLHPARVLHRRHLAALLHARRTTWCRRSS